MDTIDVTQIEPRLKHPTIFESFDKLTEGDQMIIFNDHDPKPLYYQMIAERGRTFEWEYLLNGPENWEVKITKLPSGQTPVTIGELAAKDYRKAEVFRKYGIDFCCGGKKTLTQVCEKKGLDVLRIQQELEELDKQPDPVHENYNEWELDALVDHIINKHHRYVSDAHPLLLEFSAKVARVHGDRHPELIEIERLFNNVAQELNFHMHKEEMVLFPYIKRLNDTQKQGLTLTPPSFGTIENPIAMMESEHTSAGENLERIKELSGNFTPPADACNSYRVLFAKLREYETDLHQHIHLENNILFPEAIRLEKELLS